MSWLRLACLVLANALIPYAVYVFAIGFFPYKPFLPGLASFEDQDAGEEIRMLEGISRPAPVFDKVFFMVVDALRRFVLRVVVWRYRRRGLISGQ